MVSHSPCLRFLTAGFLGLVCALGGEDAFFYGNRQAIAQPIPTSDTEIIPTTGHYCVEGNTAQAARLGEFRQSLLETAVVVSQSIENPAQKGEMLERLSDSYACLGQREPAIELAEQALNTAASIEDRNEQANLLVEVAAIYGERLGDVARMNEIVEEAIALLDTTTATPIQSSTFQSQILAESISLYLKTSQYQKAREVVDTVNNVERRQQVLLSLSYLVDSREFEENKAQIDQIFPELSAFEFSSNVAETEDSNLFSAWYFELFEQVSEINRNSSSQAEIDDFIAEQLLTLEQMPEVGAQVYGYVALGQHLLSFEHPEKAIAIFELALKTSDSMADDMSDSELMSAGLDIEMLIGFALVQAGEVDKALEIVGGIENLPEQIPQKLSLMGMVANYLSYLGEREQAQEIVIEMEDLVRLAVPNSADLLVDIAIAYFDIEDLGNARRVVQEVLSDSNVANRNDIYSYSELSYLLLSLEEYEQAADLAKTTADDYNLVELTAALISAEQDELAWELFEAITSNTQQIQALLNIAEAYEKLGHADRAFELAFRTLDMAQNADISEDVLYADALDYYEGEEQDLIDNGRRSLISNVLTLYQAESQRERQLQLIQNITDDNMRVELMLQKLPVADVLREETDIFQLALGDRTWRLLANKAANEALFFESITAILNMASPYEQASILVTTANCNTDETTVASGATQRLLEQMQQQYSVGHLAGVQFTD